MTLEDRLEQLLADETLSRDEKLLQLSKVFLQHAPKQFSGWSVYLRRIADYIDTRPVPVELSTKAIAGLLELERFK